MDGVDCGVGGETIGRRRSLVRRAMETRGDGHGESNLYRFLGVRYGHARAGESAEQLFARQFCLGDNLAERVF